MIHINGFIQFFKKTSYIKRVKTFFKGTRTALLSLSLLLSLWFNLIRAHEGYKLMPLVYMCYNNMADKLGLFSHVYDSETVRGIMCIPQLFLFLCYNGK